MQLCVFNQDNHNQGFVIVDNSFIKSYMKNLNETQLKVYLLGLQLCSNPLSTNNCIEYIKDTLSISEDLIISTFTSLEEFGLVKIVSISPLQVIYHSAIERASHKTFKKEKYADFNVQLQQLFPDKMLLNLNDYNRYYEFIEANNISCNTLLMIIKHCINSKGARVSQNYILQLAASWVNDGIRTDIAVEERIRQREQNSGDRLTIAQAIGKTSSISDEDKDYYLKWTENWGFSMPAILAACKKSYKTFAKLDSVLNDCFNNAAMSDLEIESFLKNKKKLIENAIHVVQSLGLYYENITPVIDVYISPWVQLGYSFNSISAIAKYCFLHSIKKLENLDIFIRELYRKGIVSDEQITDYFEKLYVTDLTIKAILSEMNINRSVIQNDRDLFNVWTSTWGFSIDLIKYIASINISKPFSEIGVVLSNLKDNNIYAMEDAKAYLANKKIHTKSAKKFNENDKTYSQEELDKQFMDEDDLDKVTF